MNAWDYCTFKINYCIAVLFFILLKKFKTVVFFPHKALQLKLSHNFSCPMSSDLNLQDI